MLNDFELKNFIIFIFCDHNPQVLNNMMIASSHKHPPSSPRWPAMIFSTNLLFFREIYASREATRANLTDPEHIYDTIGEYSLLIGQHNLLLIYDWLR